MSKEEVSKTIQDIQHDFHFIMLEDGDMNLDNILSKFKAAILRYGVRGVVIDPWNELEHNRPSNLTETEYTSLALGKIRKFARVHQVHVWLVAHPTKLQKYTNGNYPVPRLYDISGSAHFYNKADNGITVYRRSKEDLTDIHISKVRFKEVGKPGMATLKFNRESGRYFS